MATATAASRIANQDINVYSRNQFGSPFSELTAQQKAGTNRLVCVLSESTHFK